MQSRFLLFLNSNRLSILKLESKDCNVEKRSINEIDLLIDHSKIQYKKEVFSLPFPHKMIVCHLKSRRFGTHNRITHIQKGQHLCLNIIV